MIRRPPRSKRTATLFPYTTLFRSREARAVLLLRNDNAEELVLLEDVPPRRRQVGVDVGYLPVVDLPAQFLVRAVEEGLLLVGELRRRLRQQLVPVRVAREQLALEAHRTRLQCDALGLRQRRQDPAVELQQRRGDQRLADGGDQQRQGAQRRQRAGNHGGDRGGPQQPDADQQGGRDRRPPGQDQAVVGGACAGEEEGDERKREAQHRTQVNQPDRARTT